jgi:hypothetical protein
MTQYRNDTFDLELKSMILAAETMQPQVTSIHDALVYIPGESPNSSLMDFWVHFDLFCSCHAVFAVKYTGSRK